MKASILHYLGADQIRGIAYRPAVHGLSLWISCCGRLNWIYNYMYAGGSYRSLIGMDPVMFSIDDCFLFGYVFRLMAQLKSNLLPPYFRPCYQLFDSRQPFLNCVKTFVQLLASFQSRSSQHHYLRPRRQHFPPQALAQSLRGLTVENGTK